MKKIFILLSVAFFGMFGAFAQAPVIYTKMTAAGYEFKYLKIDSGLIVPFRDTFVYRNANQPGIMVYKPGSGFFGYNGTNWTALAGSGGATDTTSLSNRINQKLNIVDTANVRVRLSAGTNITSISGTYPNLTINAAGGSTDTTSLSNRINQKLDIVDTANVRVRLSAGTNITSISGTYPNLTINAASQSTDTTSLSNRINQKLDIVDTANIAFRPIAGANIELSGTYPNLTITGTGGSGGGSSINYYLNGSVNQGTFGGDIYYQLSQTPIIGGGTNFTRLNSSGNGYVASFITDAGQPNILNIPGGNWNLEFYFNSSSSGGSPQFYGEIYKYDGSTFTLIASGSTNPETITNGTTVDQYYTSIPMPQTTLLSTDRLAVRVYVITGGRNITLHTEDNNLSEVLTTINIPAWKTSGNADVNASQFLGSTNNASLRFKTFGEDRMILDSIGRLQINGLVNNTSYPNALQLANKNGRSIFDITTGGTVTNLTIKANNNAIGDSLVISDTGLIQSRSNTSIWLKGNTTGTGNVNVNAWRSSSAGTGSIFSANVGTNAPIFNMLSTGQMSVGSETPASTAALDITSTSRGLLIPRMTTSIRNAIGSPATGLMIWNTDDTTLHNYTGNTWRRMISANPNGTINYTAPSVTGTTVTPIMDLAQTWNNASLSNTGFRLNVTNSASQNTSLLMDLQNSGSSIFSINPSMTSTSKVNISRAGGGAGFVLSNPSVSGQNFTVAISSNSAVFSMGSGITGSPNFYIGNQGGFAAMGLTNGSDRNVRCVFGNNGSDVSGFYSTLMSSGNFDPGVGGSIFGSTTQYVSFHANPTINQASGTSITRGLYVNPTLTSASDFRGIDVTNGSIVLPYTGQSATYAIKTSDYLVNVTSGTFTATLPTAVGCTGKNYVLKNSGTGTITIATTSSQTIDGATTYSLNAQYKYLHVVSNGSNWIIIANN